MVHFFGIFGPGALARNETEEAPAKANFFGGLSETRDDTAVSRLESEACYLAGKAPEPEPRGYRDTPLDGTWEG
jgi:hypothetical protein